MKAGRFCGALLRVHPLLIVLLGLAAGLGHGLQALVLLFSLLAHELAHWLAAWALEIRVEEVELTPIGGLARLDAALEADPQAESVVALAGPLQSLGLAALSLWLLGSQWFDPALVRFCLETNASLAFFNLVPALPLDGGRMVRAILARRLGYARVTQWMAGLGRLIGAAMVILGLLLLLARRLYPTLLVGGLLLWLTAGRELENAPIRAVRGFLRKGKLLKERRVLPAQALVALAEAPLGVVLRHLVASRVHLVLVVDDRMDPLGLLHEAQLLRAFEHRGPGATLSELLGA